MNKVPTNIIIYYSYVDYPLLSILTAICKSSLQIEEHIRYSGIHGLHGNHTDQSNASGDIQKKLDVVANDIMIENLIHSYACNILLSEENDEPIRVPAKCKGPYSIAFDPLDGSSNIDCNGPIGTIFSITKNEKDEVLLPGNRIVMAGYVLYGPSTEMVVAHNGKVNRFQLNSAGQYLHIGPIVLNGLKKIYSINEGNYVHFPQGVKDYIKYCQLEEGDRPYTSRYIGSLVSDFHRNMIKGGIYLYPTTSKAPNGKLRLLYECNPMAFIAEQAGGKASNGFGRIMEIQPTELHQRVPFYSGNKEMVEKAEEFIAKAK